MSTNQIEMRIEKLQAIEREIEEKKAQAEAIKNAIKEQMEFDNVEVIKTPKFIIRWSLVNSARLDTKLVRELLGKETYASLCKNILSRKWSVTC